MQLAVLLAGKKNTRRLQDHHPVEPADTILLAWSDFLFVWKSRKPFVQISTTAFSFSAPRPTRQDH